MLVSESTCRPLILFAGEEETGGFRQRPAVGLPKDWQPWLELPLDHGKAEGNKELNLLHILRGTSGSLAAGTPREAILAWREIG